MKRIIFAVLMLTFLMPSASAGERKFKTRDVIRLVNEFKSEEGFDVVSVGSFGLGLVKMVAKLEADDEEDRQALKLLDNINKVVVVEYEEASDADRKAFDSRLGHILENAEKVLEVKEDGENLNIYGTSADDGGSIDDLMIYVQEDCALICILGSVSMEDIASLVEMTNE